MMNGTLDGALFRQLIGLAQASGSPRVVFLSSLAASEADLRIGQLHKDKEDALAASGLPYAIVRAGAFMSNSYQWLGSIRAEGVVYNAAGDTPFATIDPADIAAVAVHALTVPALEETLFEVTGGETLTLPERVQILARYLGKPLRTVDIPVEKAAERLRAMGLPPQVAAAVAESVGSLRAGRGRRVTDTVQRVTGRPPRTYEQWAKEHAARFA